MVRGTPAAPVTSLLHFSLSLDESSRFHDLTQSRNKSKECGQDTQTRAASFSAHPRGLSSSSQFFVLHCKLLCSFGALPTSLWSRAQPGKSESKLWGCNGDAWRRNSLQKSTRPFLMCEGWEQGFMTTATLTLPASSHPAEVPNLRVQSSAGSHCREPGFTPTRLLYTHPAGTRRLFPPHGFVKGLSVLLGQAATSLFPRTHIRVNGHAVIGRVA